MILNKEFQSQKIQEKNILTEIDQMVLAHQNYNWR